MQYKKADELVVIADSQYNQKEWIEELNYRLLDYSGKDLLEYNTKYNAVILPSIFIKNNTESENEEIFKLLYILKNYDEEYDLTDGKINSGSQKLYFPVDKITFEKLKRIKGVKGFYVYSYNEVDRNEGWKIENLITNTRNIVDNSLKKENSLEMFINSKVKDNKRPYIEFALDMDGNINNKENEKDYLNNKNIMLTLDRDFQDKIKELLNNKYNKHEQIGVMVMESETGNIKAMVQKNDKLPNVNIGAETLNGFFPGSIFKTIILEGILEEGEISLDDKMTCKGLYEGGKDKKNSGHGTLSVEDAFVISCNDIYSQLGNKLGGEKILELIEKQNIFSKVLGFEREQGGALEKKELKIEDGSLGITAIGQNIRITPVQAMEIVNTIVNDGVYIKPRLVEGLVDKNGEVDEKIESSKWQAFSKDTANKVKRAMKRVVNEGTGRSAKVEGIEIGGKTGSTERIENGEKYSDGWFIGYFNKDDKYYSVVVFVKGIDKDNESGGNTASPIFSDIVKIK
ncbi:penicillin-binding transpeptidase domain-containing protein [uncultured Clostridium sp.]|uniref:penicillin-binding transpeptidase domain-containing protein n=1 Tax=uncultured Clostridium sp. TaxID=59620 RepID=UPI0028EE9800|nr:penicillin-binding transpeptidase domain-containing protein [uncultured Clostridium sp.]